MIETKERKITIKLSGPFVMANRMTPSLFSDLLLEKFNFTSFGGTIESFADEGYDYYNFILSPTRHDILFKDFNWNKK